MVPGEVDVERSAAVVAFEPVAEEVFAAVGVASLEEDVGDRVGGVAVVGSDTERSFGVLEGVGEVAGLVVGEGVLSEERPVFAVLGLERLEHGQELFGEVGDARAAASEDEQAVGEPDHEHVARELVEVLSNEPERLVTVAFDHQADGLDVLLLAPGGVDGELPGVGDGLPGPGHIHGVQLEQAFGGVRYRESVVCLDRLGDGQVGAVDLREEAVDGLDVLFSGLRRLCCQRKLVAVFDSRSVCHGAPPSCVTLVSCVYTNGNIASAGGQRRLRGMKLCQIRMRVFTLSARGTKVQE